ncbi:MAG: hypothetical protein ACKPBT_13135 [Microcystis aeruginosa]
MPSSHNQLSVISYQLSVGKLSVISYQLSVGKLTVIRCEFLSVQY